LRPLVRKDPKAKKFFESRSYSRKYALAAPIAGADRQRQDARDGSAQLRQGDAGAEGEELAFGGADQRLE
jgi:hypothetical protein